MSRLLDGLNPAQRKAVMHADGPLLIIAGPGSGKTHTVACSIAYAIKERGVIPDRILAFSFTRKASEELRHRVQEVMERDENATDVWISTFHSFCGKVLHQDGQQLDISNRQEFTVNELTHLYNEGARARIEYLQHHQFAEPEDALRFINECRAADVSPAEAGSYAQHRDMSPAYVEIYQRYGQLAQNDEANYTEIQLLTNALLRDVPEVRERWQEKFELIFVDEYQDTDPIQYQIIKTLAGRHQNLRVVGDDDQGIYGFRGADIQNILNFEEDYCNSEVISLGQNYRSTQRIVEASRALAEFNPDRREKELFTHNSEGEKVKHLHCENNEEEAAIIAEFISRIIQEGRNPSDFAVLCRSTKIQAEAFTKAFKELEIPYHVVGNSSNRDTAGVSLMTIHKAKGLEFPNVFVAGVCAGLLPFHNSNEQDWGEELRILYVAMTRAKNWLCLSSYEEDAQYPRGKSQFLDYIPDTLLESVETLEDIPIPPAPEDMICPQELSDYVEPLPEQLLGDGMTVIGVDPGNIGARNTNVGWSVTQKTSDGYSVLASDTERPTGTPKDKIGQIEQKIKTLIQFPSNQPYAIAVEKLEVATAEARKEWFLNVAACVATVRSIANSEDIECHLYTPQHVKHAATGDRKASKEDVQKAVKRMCNLSQIPEPHHTADAIATSLCYLRSYINSSRFEGNKRKEENYNLGIAHLDNLEYSQAIAKFNEAISIDPMDARIRCDLGRAYLGQGDLEYGENQAKKAIRLTENNHPDSQKLLDAIAHYHSGCNSLNDSEWNMAIDKFQESIKLERVFTEAHCGLSKAYLEIGNLEASKNAAEEALNLMTDYPPARGLLNNVKMKSYYKGKTYFNGEEYDKAIIELQRAVTIDPDFKGAYLHLGKTYLKSGKLEGDDYRKREFYTKAEESCQQAIRIDDKYRNAYNSLGITYHNMKEYHKAISAYQKAINIDESSHVVHTNLSMVYLDISEYVKAVKSLKDAIAIKPDYQMAYYNLARAYFNMENLPDASKAVLEAKRLDANDQDTLNLLKKIQDAHLEQAHDYFSMNNLDASESSAKEAFKLNSSYQPAIDLLEDIKKEYYDRGLTSVEQNDWNSAENFSKKVLRIEKVLRVDRNNQLASALLRQAHYEQGLDHIKNSRYVEAINILQKANDIDPNCECEKTHYYLGKAYYKLGSLKKAQLSLNKALDIQANYLQASKLLSEIYHPRNWLKLGVANVRHFTRRILKLNQD